MFDALLAYLEALSQSVSPYTFVFIGGILEELVAPIPSYLVGGTAGSLAATQQFSLLEIALLILVASISKTLGGILIYLVSARFHGLVYKVMERFLRIKQSEIDKLTNKFTQGGRDDLSLFILRAFPLFPTMPVSIVAGLIKLPFKTYIVASFLGYIIRNAAYIMGGYQGTKWVDLLPNFARHPLFIIGGLIVSAILATYFVNKWREKEE